MGGARVGGEEAIVGDADRIGGARVGGGSAREGGASNRKRQSQPSLVIGEPDQDEPARVGETVEVGVGEGGARDGGAAFMRCKRDVSVDVQVGKVRRSYLELLSVEAVMQAEVEQAAAAVVGMGVHERVGPLYEKASQLRYNFRCDGGEKYQL